MTATNGHTSTLPPEHLEFVRALASRWKDGSRNKLAAALAGTLLRGGKSVEAAEAAVQHVAEAADDDEVGKRVAFVQRTADALEGGKPATGLPTLHKLLKLEMAELRRLLVGIGCRLSITLQDLADNKQLPIDFLQALGLHDLPEGGVGIRYHTIDGIIAAVKRRTSLRAGDGSFWPKGLSPRSYGENHLRNALKVGYLVLVEGESDCWTGWYHGYPMLGLPGEGTPAKTLTLAHLTSLRKLYVVQEPDAGGEAFVANVRARLTELGWSGQLLVVKLDGAKDPSDLHCQGPEQFKARFQAALDAAEPSEVETVKAVCLADVKAQRIEWEWDRWIVSGTLNLLDGDPGLGKSFVTLDIAARCSRGWAMPPGEGPDGRPPRDVLILNAEDDLARTIRPRLEELGADMRRIHALPDLPDGDGRRPPVLPDDISLIETIVRRHGCRLVVIDPFMAFLTGKVDAHKDADVRRVLYRLKMMAERTQSALVIVRHLNKLVNVADPLYRGGGSIGFIGAARSAMLIGEHPEIPEIRVLSRSKGNLSTEPTSLTYQIETHGHAAKIIWLGESELRAKDLLSKGGAKAAEKATKEAEALADAKAFLLEELAEGPVEANVVVARAEQLTHSKRTLYRAKRDLGVRSSRRSMGGAWYWSLPNDQSADNSGTENGPAPEGCQTPPDTNSFGNLRENDANPQCFSEDCQGEGVGNLREGVQDVGNLREEGATADDYHLSAEDCQASEASEGCQMAEVGNLRKNTGESENSAEGCQITVCPGLVGNLRDGTAWTLVRDLAELPAVFQACEETDAIGIDTETTGLDSRRDHLRLLTLATDRGVWVIDCRTVDVRPLWDWLDGHLLLFHNAAFDLSFLAVKGFEPGRVACTMLLSQLLYGTRRPKGFHTLATCVERELGETLPKELQRADWSGQLSHEQLAYAARDAAVLVPLYGKLMGKIKATAQGQVAEIEGRCLPAMVWLSRSGITFDADAWRRLAEEADAEVQRLAAELDGQAPRPEQGEMFTAGWNWGSPEQVKAVFALLGVTLDSTDDDALAGVNHPLAGLLRQYRGACKLVSTYGKDWKKLLSADGRIHAGWRQIGADSGRMACREPNLQNLPRDPRYRACFVAPAGRLLVKADFSQVELRIAAKVASDKAMLDAYRKGEDLHKRTAKAVLGVADVSKADRQLAKSLNFGLCFGMGAKRFREYAATNYGVELTNEQAADYRRAFFAAYPGLARWHQEAGRQAGRRGGPDTIETHTLAGRRRTLNRSKAKGEFPYSELLNSPVQGTGADGLKQALALLWERRADCPGAFPVLAVHDEIVVECDANQADAAAAWLKQAMLDGMAPLIAPVPVEVDVTVSKTWGGGD